MIPKNYVITVRFQFASADDVEARKELDKMKQHYEHAPATSFNLQEVFLSGPPRGVRNHG